MSEQQPRPSRDELVIDAGIWESVCEDREVEDPIARMLAAQLHEGQATALYYLASTGAIDLERLSPELDMKEASEQIQAWSEVLLSYCQAKGDRGPVAGWSRLWVSRDE